MMQYYPLFVSVLGWVLLAGSVLLAMAPLQFILKGESALGDDGVLHYFLAFCASLNAVWALVLLVAASDPLFAQKIAWANAVGFALLSLWRIPLSRNPQVLERLGKAPQAEVVVFALIAAVFAAAAVGA